MYWRLFVFRLRRFRRSALVLLLVLFLVAGTTLAWVRLTRQEFRLTVLVTDSAFVSAVEIHSACCRLTNATINLASPSATFVLQRGDYTISATPSSEGYQQHWYLVPALVHLDGDRTIDIHGTYGRG